jgi:hypothetical protein
MEAPNDFVALARRWAPFVRSSTRIAVALRAADGWHLRFALTAFSAEVSALLAQSLDVETRSIRAFRRLVSLDAASAAVAINDALARPHEIQGEHWTAALAPDSIPLNYNYQRLYPSRMPGPSRLPSLLVTASPTQRPDFPPIEALDLELLAHTTPFESLAELLIELKVPIDATQITQDSFAELILLPPAAIDQSSCIDNGELKLDLIAHPNLDTQKLRIGFKSYPSNSQTVQRFSVKGEELPWSDDGSVIRARYSSEVPDTPVMLALLSYDDEFLSRWWVRDNRLSYNDRFQLHRTVDMNDVFRKTFFVQRNDFEDRVVLLLELLGLSALKYGRIATLTEGPDILAVSPQRHLYVIECTTGDINSKGKLQRLHDRTKAIMEGLSRSSSPPVATLSVVFTSIPRQETAAHWMSAANLNVALVCREEIGNLLAQLEAPPTPDQLYRAALAAIPANNQPHLP